MITASLRARATAARLKPSRSFSSNAQVRRVLVSVDRFRMTAAASYPRIAVRATDCRHGARYGRHHNRPGIRCALADHRREQLRVGRALAPPNRCSNIEDSIQSQGE